MDVDKNTGELSPKCPKCAHGGNVDLFPDKRMCMACGHVYPKRYLSDMESMKEENLMDDQKRIEPTDAGPISQTEQDNYMKLAHAYQQLETQLSNAQAEIEALKKERTMSGIHGRCMMEESNNEIILLRRELAETKIKNHTLSNIVSVLNCGMQTMVFTPNELAGHECLAKHKLLSLFDYWRKKVAPTMRALVNGNEDSQVKKLETELADKDRQLADARAEIKKWLDWQTRKKVQIDEMNEELIDRDRLLAESRAKIEQMKCCTNCGSRLWAATGEGDCKNCKDFSAWTSQSKAAETTEGGE